MKTKEVLMKLVAARKWGSRGETGRRDASPLSPLSIAPVESGPEVMIERDATIARSHTSKLYQVSFERDL